MPFRPEDVEAFLEMLRSNPELRERVRRALVDDDLRAITAVLDWVGDRLDRVVSASEELAEREAAGEQRLEELRATVQGLAASVAQQGANVERLTERVDALAATMSQQAEQMVRLTARVAQLAERLDQLTARVDQLTGRVDQLTARVEEIAANMVQLTSRVDQLTGRVDQLTARVEEIAANMVQLTSHVDQLTGRVDQLTALMDQMVRRFDWMAGKLGNLEGWQFEHRYLQNLASRLGRYYRNVRLLTLPDEEAVARALESGALTEEQYRDVLNLDAVAQARPRNGDGEVILAIELSVLVDERDVRRARDRASSLQRVFPERVEAIAAGQAALPEAEGLARELGVMVLIASDAA